ncbi:MAG: NAD(P)H-hydrate dehydratase [Bacillota bacterium]|nr:NAD(P)H-hydrate dehydratase [Bacillota bacterium]
MKLVTSAQMRKIDAATISNIGIPGIVLMENAALKVVEAALATMGQIKGKIITVFAGKGNNGGDAFAAARHLFNKGAKVKVYLPAQKGSITGDALINLKALENTGAECIEISQASQLESIRDELAKSHLIVDGIFGTGIKGEIAGIARDVIESINSAGKPVLSIDIPSGINGDTGKISGVCIKAQTTVTFGLPKIGLFVYPGRQYAGELIVADIGIPSRVVGGMDININTIEREYAASLIPGRIADSSKGDYGKVFIAACSNGMTGAGCLAAESAMRAGAGLVYLGVPSSLVNVCDSLLAESVTLPLDDDGTGHLSINSLQSIMDRIDKCDAAAVGPGLSLTENTVYIVSQIIKKSNTPLILDADALNAVSLETGILSNLKTTAVITPHPGEMARLTGITIEQVQNNRIDIAMEFSRKWNVITVLKGAGTIVASPDGRIFVNTTGNSGMATAGAGDVLTGIIAGLAGQGANLFDAAVAGVYLHGLAGDRTAKIKGEYGLIAGDIVRELPFAIKELMGSNINFQGIS